MRIVSARTIRYICLLKYTDGFFLGRIWNRITVNYKDISPVRGGLFCDCVFGATREGICKCKKTFFRNYPVQTKFIRLKLLYCTKCFTQTVYFPLRLRRTPTIVTNFLFAEFLYLKSKNTHLSTIIVCKCGHTTIHSRWFYIVNRICTFCLTSTLPYTKNWFMKTSHVVDYAYQPGFCNCGRSNTECVFGAFILCGYCG